MVLLQNKEEKLKHAALKILYEKEDLKILYEKEDTQEKVDDQNIYITIISLLSNISKEYFLSKVKANDAVKVES